MIIKRNHGLISILVFVFFFSIISVCSSSEMLTKNLDSASISKAKVKVTPSTKKMQMSIDGQQKIFVTTDPDGADITYSSNKKTIVSINSQTGVMTALKSGKASIRITAETPGYKNGTAIVSVQVVKDAILVSLDKQDIEILPGATSTITPTADVDNCIFNYASNNTSVAKISQNGTLTAVKAGEALITVTASRSGEKTGYAYCRVIVSKGTTPPEVTYDNNILSFRVAGQAGSSIISDSGNEGIVLFYMPEGSLVNSLTPEIIISSGASITPPSGVPQNFSDKNYYIVTSGSGEQKIWTIECRYAEGNPNFVSFNVTGSLINDTTENEIVSGGRILKIKANNADWIGANTTSYQSGIVTFIQGLTASSEMTQWSKVIANLQNNYISQISYPDEDTMQIIMPETNGYDIVKDQIISITTIPAILLNKERDIPLSYNPINFSISALKMPLLTLSGTVLTSTETDIVNGGKTLQLLLNGGKWIEGNGITSRFYSVSTANSLINSITSFTEKEQWQKVAAIIKDTKTGNTNAAIQRISDTAIKIDFPSVPNYNIVSSQAIGITVPAIFIHAAYDDVYAGSFSISSVPPSVSNIVIVTQPAMAYRSGIVNDILTTQPVLKLYDEDGTFLSDNNHTIVNAVISSYTTGSGLVLGGTTLAQAVNGVVTFNNLALYAPTDCTGIIITFTTVNGNTVSVQASPFNYIKPIPKTISVITQPAITARMSTLPELLTSQPAIRLSGDLGELLVYDDYSSIEAFVVTPAGVTMGGINTVAAVDGIATFTGLTIHAAKNIDNVILGFDVVGNTAVSTSAIAFDYASPAVSSLAFATTPEAVWTTSTAAIMTTAAAIKLLDAGGNLITTENTLSMSAILVTPSSITLGGVTVAQSVNGIVTFTGLTMEAAAATSDVVLRFRLLPDAVLTIDTPSFNYQ